MKMYIFPLNFDYSNKFLGILEYKTLLPTCIIGVILAIIISKISSDILTRYYIFHNNFLTIFLLANTKIFNEPLLSFLICIIKHYLYSGNFIKWYVVRCGVLCYIFWYIPKSTVISITLPPQSRIRC